VKQAHAANPLADSMDATGGFVPDCCLRTLCQNAAKQEIKMIELRRFKLPVATPKLSAFDFERASLALLAQHKRRCVNGFRSRTIVQQGLKHHG
jgi:hypothetical protein